MIAAAPQAEACVAAYGRRELLEKQEGQWNQHIHHQVDEGDVPHEQEVRHGRRVPEPAGLNPRHGTPQCHLRLRGGSIEHHSRRRLQLLRAATGAEVKYFMFNVAIVASVLLLVFISEEWLPRMCAN